MDLYLHSPRVFLEKTSMLPLMIVVAMYKFEMIPTLVSISL